MALKIGGATVIDDNKVVVSGSKLGGVAEVVSIVASPATGTIALNVITSGTMYYTSNATANWTMNIRGDASTTLNSILAIGDSVTVTFLATNGATAYYASALQIDGSAVTPKYANAGAWTTGNASAIDAYTYTILKTANATFTAFASQTRFA